MIGSIFIILGIGVVVLLVWIAVKDSGQK